MTTIPQAQTIVQYQTNVSQFQYTFAFYAPLPTDIVLYYQAPNATPVPSSDQLAYNSDYTVTYNPDPITGGYITLLFTPITGYYLTINRQVGASLTTNFANTQTFNGANLDAALDRLLLLCQQNQNYALERNLSYLINTYLPNATPFTQLPPLLQNMVWIGSGSGVTSALLASSPSASVLQSLLAANGIGVDGARLVGYYDNANANATTVDAFLTYLQNLINTIVTPYLIPPGFIADFGSTSLPAGWIECNGAVISRTTYAALFAAISTTWGAGDGSTTFAVPNLNGAVTLGRGGSVTPVFTGNTVGYVGGEYVHAQSVAEMPAHNHPGSSVPFASEANSRGGGAADTVTNFAPTSVSVAIDGGSVPFNIMQQGGVVLKMIKF